MTTLRTAVALLGAAAIAACGETARQDITAPVTGARVKFFNFAVNAPGVNFYANDRKMTAISSATAVESTVGVNFGGVGSGGFYSALEPGQYTFSGRIAAATDKDLPIASAQATLVDGRAYSFYTSGVYNTATKQADAFVVEDAFPEVIDFTVTQVRFVNASHNAPPVQLLLRNVTTNAEAPVGAAVAYKAAGAFTPFSDASPVFVNSGGLVDLVVRTPGGTTNLVTRTGASFGKGRVYTVTLRGDMTVTSTTAANRPFLDITANR